MSDQHVDLAPGIRRLTAPNPSLMTHTGTQTYILGTGGVAVIDPGPAVPDHIAAILSALAPGEHVAKILVTHAHLDHSPGAALLAAQTGAAVFGYGPAHAGRRPVMAQLAQNGLVGGGEGVDYEFEPDERLQDSETLSVGGMRITALHTPGHLSNHVCFATGDVVFSGDLVMGWATSLVSPPDGDLSEFMTSCRRLHDRRDAILYPGHGDPVENPQDRIGWLIAHREEREQQIIAALQGGGADIRSIVRQIYTDTPDALHGSAARNVLAHLIDLTERGLVAHEDRLSADARFYLQ